MCVVGLRGAGAVVIWMLPLMTLLLMTWIATSGARLACAINEVILDKDAGTKRYLSNSIFYWSAYAAILGMIIRLAFCDIIIVLFILPIASLVMWVVANAKVGYGGAGSSVLLAYGINFVCPLLGLMIGVALASNGWRVSIGAVAVLTMVAFFGSRAQYLLVSRQR